MWKFKWLDFIFSIFLVLGFVSAVNVTSCQTISSPGNYSLINDIDATNEGGSCFNISSENVYFDCQDFTITNVTKAFDFSSSFVNSTFDNCNFEDGFILREFNSSVTDSSTGFEFDYYISELSPENFSIVVDLIPSNSSNFNVSSYSVRVTTGGGSTIHTFSDSNDFVINSTKNILNNTFGYAGTSSVITIDPTINVSLIKTKPELPTGDLRFILELDHDFEDDDDEIDCELTIDDDYTFDYTFNDDSSNDDMELEFNFSEDFVLDCGDKLEEIEFTLYDEEDDKILVKDYENEDEVEYEFYEDLYKLVIDIDHDFDDDEEIECDLDYDKFDVSFDFDEGSSSRDLKITKYFAEKVYFECDHKLDDVTIEIFDDDGDDEFDDKFRKMNKFNYSFLDDEDDSFSNINLSTISVSVQKGVSLKKNLNLYDYKTSRIKIENSAINNIEVAAGVNKNNAEFTFTPETFTKEGKKILFSSKKIEMPHDGFDVYEVLSVDSEVSNMNLAWVEFSFKVSKSWLNDNGYLPTQVYMMRLSEGKVSSLKPVISSDDASYYYFTLKTEGFSSYAVVGKNVSGSGETLNSSSSSNSEDEVSKNVEDSVNENSSVALSGEDGEGESLESENSVDSDLVDGDELNEEKGMSLWLKIVIGIVLFVFILWLVK